MNELRVEMVDEIIRDIKSSKCYQSLLEHYDIMENDLELKKQLEQLEKAKNKYFEAKQYGAFHPDLKDRQRVYAEVKSSVFSLPIIIDFKKSESCVQEMLQEISEELASVVSSNIKFPNELGLIRRH
jgi:cell fate (sporulation/competence/biofilm development) regulator YlbF (YheA/YmcA/DUF963 family)